MNTLFIPFMAVLVILVLTVHLSAQSTLAYTEPGSHSTINKAAEKSDPAPVYHFHKKLPYTYNGYAIEVASSTFPMDRTRPVFRQFGNIHYDKLERGGYSYLILARFSSDEAGLHFLNNIIVPKANKARLVHYKDGIRKIIRED